MSGVFHTNEEAYDAFVDKLATRVAALQVGPASEAASQIGPMINARAIEKIDQHVKDAVAKGAELARTRAKATRTRRSE